MLRKVVDKSRLCLCTIHQPSSEILDLFDSVVLLSAGRVVFSGSVQDATQHFVGLGYRLSAESGSAVDVMLDICAKRVAPVNLAVVF